MSGRRGLLTFFAVLLIVFGLSALFGIPCIAGVDISDDFSSDSGLWTSYGSAYRDTTNGYLVLTKNVNNTVGQYWLKQDINGPFIAEFKYKSGGGTGADGLVFMFYKNKDYTPPGEGGSLGFSGRGYGIEFDTYYNSEYHDPNGGHIALINNSINNHLTYYSTNKLEDSKWHDVKVVVGWKSVAVYFDGSKVIDWSGNINRTYKSIGFSAATGGSNNWHFIDDVKITEDTTPPVINSFLINDGAYGSNINSVKLQLDASDNLSAQQNLQMRFSNDNENWSSWEPFQTSKDHILSAGYGLKTVYAQVKDEVGNIASAQAKIYLDDTIPMISITDPQDNSIIGGTYTVVVDTDDPQSGIDNVVLEYSLDGIKWTEIGETDTAPYQIPWDTGEMNRTGVYLRATSTNGAGYTNSATITGLTVDNTLPVINSFTINNGAQYTNSRYVTLQLGATDDVSSSNDLQMRFSNNRTEWSAWENYAESKSWELSYYDGSKTVYVQVKDQAGNITEAYSNIIYDTVPPALYLERPSKYLKTNTSPVTVAGTTEIGAIVKVNGRVVENQDGSFNTSVDLSAGDNTIIVTATDPAGNTTTRYRTVTLDQLPPIIKSFTINNGAQVTNHTTVELGLQAVDNVSSTWNLDMRFSNDQTEWTPWENYSSTRQWTLVGEDGLKTVYVQVRDEAGNIATDQASIILDTTPPDLIVIEPLDGFITNKDKVTVKGITDIDASVTVNEQAVENVEGSFTTTVDLVEGENIIRVAATSPMGYTNSVEVKAFRDTITPVINTFVINDGSPFTKSKYVTLRLIANDNLSPWWNLQMRFSIDGVNWSNWGAYRESSGWTLISGDGSKKVYAQVRDQAGNISIVVQDSIVLDTTPPILTVTEPIDGQIFTAPEINVVGVTEPGVTVAVKQVSTRADEDGNFTIPITLNEGDNIIKVTATDAAGNKATVSRTVNLNTKAPTVRANPKGGFFDWPQSVTLISSKPATIYYTTDGNKPTTESAVYVEPIKIDKTTTLKFMAIDEMGHRSPDYTEIYTIEIRPPLLNIIEPLDNCLVNKMDTTVRGYTDPGVTVIVNNQHSVQADNNGNFSLTVPLVEGLNTLTITAKDAEGRTTKAIRRVIRDTTPPQISSYRINRGEEITGFDFVELYLTAEDNISPTSDLRMRFSNDGVEWSKWEQYSGYKLWYLSPGDGMKTINVQLKDAAGNIANDARSITYDSTFLSLNSSPHGGIFNKPQSVKLMASKEGAQIYYTTDGSDPTPENGTLYTGEIYIDKDTTLKFMGVDITGIRTENYRDDYIIDTTVPTVTAAPPGGAYNEPQTVTLTPSEPATIFYTTDGSEPTTESSVYVKPIVISRTTILKFLAVDYAGNISPVYTEEYSIPESNWMIYSSTQKDKGNDWVCDENFENIVQGTEDNAQTIINYQDTNGDGNYDQAVITVKNAYPGYYNSLTFSVKNIGQTPIYVSQVKIDTSGEIQARILTNSNSYIKAGKRSSISIDFRLSERAQIGDYTFTVSL